MKSSKPELGTVQINLDFQAAGYFDSACPVDYNPLIDKRRFTSRVSFQRIDPIRTGRAVVEQFAECPTCSGTPDPFMRISLVVAAADMLLAGKSFARHVLAERTR